MPCKLVLYPLPRTSPVHLHSMAAAMATSCAMHADLQEVKAFMLKCPEETLLLSEPKGEGLQCPDCGEKDLGCRLLVAESLLPTELQGGPRPCPYKVLM